MRSYKAKENLHHWSAQHEQKEKVLSVDCNYRLSVDLGVFFVFYWTVSKQSNLIPQVYAEVDSPHRDFDKQTPDTL